MRSQTSSRSDEDSPLSDDRLCAGACEIITGAFAHNVSLLICVWIELCPSISTNAQTISTLVASVEAPYLHLHSPLIPSKAVLSSWILLVICVRVYMVCRGTRFTCSIRMNMWMRTYPLWRTYGVLGRIYYLLLLLLLSSHYYIHGESSKERYKHTSSVVTKPRHRDTTRTL